MSEEVNLKQTALKTLKIFSILLCLLAVLFFVLQYGLNKLERPYHKRDIPAEITPWLK